MLQLLGFGVVAVALNQTGQLFQVSPFHALRLWWRQRPRFGRQTTTFEANATLTGVASIGKVVVREKLNPKATLLERVQWLERRYQAIAHQADQLSEKLDLQSDDSRKKLEQERAERRSAIEGIQRQLGQAVAGDLHLEWLGLFLFVVGISCATASPELASWIGRTSACSSVSPMF